MNQGGGGDLAGLIFLGISVLFFIGVFLFYIASVIWCTLDAQRRGKSGCLVFILVAFFWPIGLIIWLVARPPKQR